MRKKREKKKITQRGPSARAAARQKSERLGVGRCTTLSARGGAGKSSDNWRFLGCLEQSEAMNDNCWAPSTKHQALGKAMQ